MENTSFTANGALTLATSLNRNVDLFAVIGSARNNPGDALKKFMLAYAEDSVTALRILLWARDARGGAGERQVFRVIMNWLAKNEKRSAVSILMSGKISEIGRFDDYVDLLCSDSIALPIRKDVAKSLKTAIKTKTDNAGLIAKWLPRKGKEAAILRGLMDLNPKEYRKMLVDATNVVESKMCSKQWDDINFGHVPSVAMSRYTKSFARNAQEKFTAYKEALVSGEVKAKAGALYPYDVTRTAEFGDAVVANEQWKALPDFFTGASKMLPMIDVSGSMSCPAGGSNNVQCVDVAVSLGIYLAERQEGHFKDLAMTFETTPKWAIINQPDIKSKVSYVKGLDWGGTTNIQAAFDLLLKTAIDNQVPQSDMPEYIIIISDMEFNVAIGRGWNFVKRDKNPETSYNVINEKFEQAGYVRPNIIFWNVNARSQNIQVKSDENGTAMITGFSPAIMQSVIKADEITPESVMLNAISSKRYDIDGLTI